MCSHDLELVATEIIQFIQLKMDLEVPQKDFQGNVRTVEEQVAWCWEYWRLPEGLVSVILEILRLLFQNWKRYPNFVSKSQFEILIRIGVNFKHE